MEPSTCGMEILIFRLLICCLKIIDRVLYILTTEICSRWYIPSKENEIMLISIFLINNVLSQVIKGCVVIPELELTDGFLRVEIYDPLT